MSTILRTMANHRGVAVIRDGRERASFSKGNLKANTAEAEAWMQLAKYPAAFERDTVLFQTNAQTVCHITDSGDNTEPKKLGLNSLIRISDDTSREMVLTGEEFAQLCKSGSELAKQFQKSEVKL